MEDNETKQKSEYSRRVHEKEEQKVRAREKGGRSIWMGLGMFGLVGWSIAIPTFLGAFLGMWLDDRYPGKTSWTLALLIAGLLLGCFNVWYWIDKENRQMHEDHSSKRKKE